MASPLDTRIQEIVAHAASQIAHAVRANIVEEVKKAAVAHVARPAARAPAPKARAKGGRRQSRGLAEADVSKVLEYVGKNPGKRSEQIRAALGISPEVTGKVLAQLRAGKKVKTKGDRRTTAYFLP
jgi:hypothetical protein